MRSRLLRMRLWPLAMAVILAGCGGGDAEELAADPESTPPAAPTTGAQTDAAADAEPWLHYQLEMPAIQRWYEAQTTIYRAMGEDPELLDDLDTTDQAGDLAGLQAHFAGIPEVRSAVEDAGLSLRDYTAILVTLTYTQGIDQAIQSGGVDRAATIQNRQVNEANLELVEQNRSELERMQRELEELGESM